MTAQLCTEDSREPFTKLIFENNEIDKDYTQPMIDLSTNNDEERGPNDAEDEQQDEQHALSQSTNNTQYTTKKTKNHFWKKFIVFFIFGCVFTGLFTWNRIEITSLKQPKSVMLYRPTSNYLNNKNRPETVEWILDKKHSRDPFMLINDTHMIINQDGFFHIACSLLMQTKNIQTNVITMLIFYSKEEEAIYTKKTMPTGFSRFSLQQSIVLYLQKGDYFYVQVTPSQYLHSGAEFSYLSIAEQ